MTTQTDFSHTNHLIYSTSPYLLQHAHNPVDWHPWGEEALQKAQKEDKPIFLSIGYSACHWCHVMERESFENETTADLMNRFFVNIKVDREERPDLDEIYMSAVQALTGQGGWPMSVFLTPDLKPFYGGTYYPPQDMYGRPSFPHLLHSIAQMYKQNRQEIHQSAQKLTEHLLETMQVPQSESPIDSTFVDRCVQEMSRRFDPQHGGFGSAPKFPHSMDISLLFRSFLTTSDPQVLKMAEFSLEKMANGGLYDQIGGGFHRYSTDSRWLIPHFEKMLYDNALLAKTYTEAFQLTQNSFYQRIVTRTLDYVLREMTSPEGGFYSSQDADSEGEEGAFFVWTPQQITEIVGESDAPIVCRYFGVEEGGNFENGSSVLHRPIEENTLAQLLEIPRETWPSIIDRAQARLFETREKRIKPGRDEKILTDWNGLMISALAFAGNVLDEVRYRNAAENACRFLLDKLSQKDVLFHTYKDGRAHTYGFLSDYAFLVQGLIDTYEASRNPQWLHEAIHLSRIMIELFWDEEQGAFFYTSHRQESLIARTKNPLDNAVPSGNSIAALNLLRLAAMTGNRDFHDKAVQTLQFFSGVLQRMPSAFPQMLIAAQFLLDPPHEILLAGTDSESLIPMQQAIFSKFIPNKVVLYLYPQSRDTLLSISSRWDGKHPLDDRPTAFVCQDFTCRQPVTNIEEMLNRLGDYLIAHNSAPSPHTPVPEVSTKHPA